MRISPLLLGLVSLGLAASTLGATFTVTTTEDTADGVCDAHCSLREAVAAANESDDRDRIELPEGVLLLAGGVLDLYHSTTLVGLGTSRTVIDGGGIDRIFDLHGGAFAITDVTLRNGYTTADGGAIRVLDRAVLNTSYVTFVANRADYSGGAIFAGGGLLVADCVFAANRADVIGGAISLGNQVGVEIVRSTFLANVAEDGSAVWAARDASATVTASLFAANRATRGGAFASNNATTNVLNTTFSANVAADSRGGALYLNAGSTTLRDCTLAGNTAPRQSATIKVSSTESITLENTLLAGPGLVQECWVLPTSAGHNLDVHDTCGLDQPSDLTSVAAGLGPLRDNGGPTLTHALLAGSRAIDAGGGDYADSDQRGTARPVGQAPDIGAYEADGDEPPIGIPLTVPVIAHVSGVGGTPWHSDASLSNPSTGNLPLTLRYTPGGSAPVTATVSLGPHASTLLEDLVTSTFALGDGRGGLEILPPAAGPVPAVLSRTFAVAGSERLGQGMPAILPLPKGTYYVPGLVEDDLFRSNLGVTAGDIDVVVQVDLFRGTDGPVGSTFAQNVAAGSQVQWRFPVMFPGLAQTGVPMTARVRIFAAASPYGSLVDQLSTDAVTLMAQPAGHVWIVPVIAHNPGGAGTFWRSDLYLHNPNPIAARIDLEYLPENTDNSAGGQTAVVTVPAYGTVTVADAAGTLFGVSNGKGALVLVSSPPVAVSSRTYTTRAVGDTGNAADAGTYGLGVPAVPPWQITAGTRTVAGIRVGNGYRTNLGFVGGSDDDSVQLTLYREDGTEIATAAIQIPSRSLVQRSVQDLFAIDWSSFTVGSVSVVTTAAPLLVYTSIVDGSSQDPIYDVATPQMP